MNIEEAIHSDKRQRENKERTEKTRVEERNRDYRPPTEDRNREHRSRFEDRNRRYRSRGERGRYAPRYHRSRERERHRSTNRPEGDQKFWASHVRTREEPRRRDDRNNPSSSRATQGTHQNNRDRRERGKDRPRDSDKSKIQCYKCGSYGHYANDEECPLRVKPAIRRFEELPEETEEGKGERTDDAEGDKEKSASEKSDKEDAASDYRGTEGSYGESESSYGGSQYDSDESMYYAEEDYEGYGSSDEEPEYFRAITIASWRGESEDESEAGPSNQEDTEPQEAIVEPVVTGMEVGAPDDDTQEDELPELEEIEEDQSDASGSTEITRVQQGSVGQFWRTEYSRVNNLLEQEEQANLRLRQRIREVEMENRGLESRIWEMGEEIRILWRSHAPDVPAELARDVLHNSMWREIVHGSPGLQGDLQDEFEGRGEPPTAGDDERRMMNAEREARINREEERQRAIDDTIVEEMMRAMGPERDREYRMAIEPKTGTRPKRAFKCLTAYVEVNGTKALALFDSGSSIDAISNEFARVAKVDAFELEKPVPIQLGTVGSRSVINFGANIPVSVHGKMEEIYLDIVNVDHYDIIVGVPLMTRYGICLDFDENLIRIRGGGVMQSLKAGESVAIAKPARRKVDFAKPRVDNKPQETK
ncbi:hypothetical protein NLI96_g1451 [Meripilus lineatus]|uniref:CCHC-type domain-containing protein n=1 Tax=Meripilus lineatus TaxID=2056292 RepID=A0AAD5YMU3_9APHY|nr:hypothetical protein NLI96_g1451 [Physisporinus lineatus]